AAPRYVPRVERVRQAVAAWAGKHPNATPLELASAKARIRKIERGRTSHAVLGFDLTFKPPKSVSVLWGIADHGTQVQLYEAHHEAVEATLKVIEAEVLRTRTGAQGVRQVGTRGLVAAAFDHWDS